MDALVAAAKVSAFDRDLSPVQLGVRGRIPASTRSFEVVGVLRKVRDAVRWNEWYLAFDDGTFGWLGEGHGTFQLFTDPAVPLDHVSMDGMQVGDDLEIEGRRWRVIEAAAAKVAAAEGELPFRALDGVAWAYADLRCPESKRVGTVDGHGDEVAAWLGHVVELSDLDLEGLRPITGWSDPALTGFAGPEISGVKKIECPNCGGGIQLRAPGQTAHVACEYCGSEIALEEAAGAVGAKLLETRKEVRFEPLLPLGSRGRLDGIEWAVIGAMVRYVTFEGERYYWQEYFLHNPYRGVRFLSQSNGHWTLYQRLVDVPDFARGRNPYRGVAHRGRAFRHFQGGRAKVDRVLGEFDWQVRSGDSAHTDDYICPPYQLSAEVVENELTWSLGRYVPSAEIADAFGAQGVGRAFGIAPNQPNPYAKRKYKVAAWLSAISLVILAFCATVLGRMSMDSERLLSQQWQVSPTTEQVVLSEPFTVPEEGVRGLRLRLKSEVKRREAQLHVVLMNETTGRVLFPLSTEERNSNSVSFTGMSPGVHRVRIEMAWSPLMQKKRTLTGFRAKPAEIKVDIETNPHSSGMLCLLFVYAFAAPILLVLRSASFETKRWADSDHAP